MGIKIMGAFTYPWDKPPYNVIKFFNSKYEELDTIKARNIDHMNYGNKPTIQLMFLHDIKYSDKEFYIKHKKVLDKIKYISTGNILMKVKLIGTREFEILYYVSDNAESYVRNLKISTVLM